MRAPSSILSSLLIFLSIAVLESSSAPINDLPDVVNVPVSLPTCFLSLVIRITSIHLLTINFFYAQCSWLNREQEINPNFAVNRSILNPSPTELSPEQLAARDHEVSIAAALTANVRSNAKIMPSDALL
jgi:hypothetical protein